MRLEFREVGDVTDVVALAVFLDVLPIHFFPGQLLDLRDGFEHRDAVFPAAPQIIDLAGPRRRRERLNLTHHVVAVDVVPHLLGLVAKDRICPARKRHLHQIRKKSVQLDPGVRRPRKAPAAKHAHIHPEIPPVLLRHQVRGSLRSPEQRVQCAINPAILIDSLVIFRPRIFPPRFQFLQRQFIRCVAIHLIRAQENKRRFRAVHPRRFQQIHRAQRIHLEIKNRNVTRLVVRWLRRAVHDQIKPLRLEKRFESRPVPYIQIVMREILCRSPQPLQIPRRIPRLAEEHPPHIVVNPVNRVPLPVKMLHSLRADQPARSRNQNCFHSHRLALNPSLAPNNTNTSPSARASAHKGTPPPPPGNKPQPSSAQAFAPRAAARLVSRATPRRPPLHSFASHPESSSKPRAQAAASAPCATPYSSSPPCAQFPLLAPAHSKSQTHAPREISSAPPRSTAKNDLADSQTHPAP